MAVSLKALRPFVAASALALAAFQAQAVLVQTTITASVGLAHATNPFGLTTTDSVTAIAIYDDALVPGAGLDSLDIGSDPSFSLTIMFGTFVFAENLDDFFGSGKPEVNFNNGDVSGIDIEIWPLSLGGFSALRLGSFTNDTRFFLDDEAASAPTKVLLEGTWNLSSAITVPVTPVVSAPEPSIVALLALGLTGLAVAGRRRRRA